MAQAAAYLEYISVGGNRHPSSADWSSAFGGYIAFGAGNSIALWSPLSSDHKGVVALLNGHTDSVNAVRFLRSTNDEAIFISGSVDKTTRAWNITKDGVSSGIFDSEVIGEHGSSVSCLEVLTDSSTVISAGADSTIKVWDLSSWTGKAAGEAKLKETVKLKIMPLAIAVQDLDATHRILAVAGSHSSVQIYVTSSSGKLELVATLAGHAGWIRSLSFARESDDSSSDILLASASQDRFIRLWRIHIGDNLPATKAVEDPSLGVIGRSMSTKIHRFSLSKTQASITFEALLLGHEDWIYTNKWHRHEITHKLQLLSASADNSLAIWEADPTSGIWVCISRLGEISAQKGSTTATGSTGGFWIGLWSPSGTAVVSLGRTGSWRVWQQAESSHDTWTQVVGIGGHVRSVADIAWERDGSYLLSTSADQTTRLHAEWIHESKKKSWHEFARPQIHGYDLNCIDTVTTSTFVSGADEKPIRAFQETSAVAEMLARLCGISSTSTNLPSAANMPVLGLSNKQIDSATTETATELNGHVADDTNKVPHPPLEDTLSRHLLFPELHKIYGHGLELSALSVSSPLSSISKPQSPHMAQDADPATQIIASSCRASSLDHAVIRLHTATTYRTYSPPLRAHSLTVTALSWSPDSRYLLSVGRDRIFALFIHDAKAEEEKVKLVCTIKGHTRMILGCAWAPLYGYLVDGQKQLLRIFVTAGRDKCVKIWRVNEASLPSTADRDGQGADEEKCTLLATVSAPAPVTAVSVWSDMNEDGTLVIAMGLETGSISLIEFNIESAEYVVKEVKETLCPCKSVNRLLFRPERSDTDNGDDDGKRELAVASEDGSLRVLVV